MKYNYMYKTHYPPKRSMEINGVMFGMTVCVLCAEASILGGGGGGGQSPLQWKYWGGGKHHFAPPPNNFGNLKSNNMKWKNRFKKHFQALQNH